MTTVAQGLFQAVGRVSRSEARLLLATTIRKPKEFLIAHPEYSLTDEEVSLFDSCLQRAQAGEPIPYIVGTQEFWGRPFRVRTPKRSSKRLWHFSRILKRPVFLISAPEAAALP